MGGIADNGGMNEQEEIMENLNDNQVTGTSGIKEERNKALKGKYQKAELIDLRFKETAGGECSDMASNYNEPITKCQKIDIYI
ncbi:MAG: hypothetical protein D3908_15210 [Candidatus Electrothrix sp. AUS4]|nr:hypothetical protein [Candidatus Electrothrix sp. AUS4]